MIQMMYGEPTGNGSDWDTFLGFVNTRPEYIEGALGGSLDANWDRDSEFWKEFMRNANTAIRQRSVGNDGTGGGGARQRCNRVAVAPAAVAPETRRADDGAI
jgi:hypothetical protein